MFVLFGNLSYLCNWSGKDPLGRRSVMLQTCGWKPEKFSSKAEIGRRAKQLPRIAWGCAPISYFRFSQDLHPELAKAVPRFCYGKKRMIITKIIKDDETITIIRFDAAADGCKC